MAPRKPAKPAPAPQTYVERLEAHEQKQKKIRAVLAAVMFAVAGFILYHDLTDVPPVPPPNDLGYYEGPWVNKSGDLVSGDGKIIERDYHGIAARRARKDNRLMIRAGVSKAAFPESFRLAP